MSRCYPFPPPGYQKKAPQLPADLAQPPKDKKDKKDKHKDKKKKKKKDGDTNGDTHDKDSSRPSKHPRTVLISDILQPKEEKQNGKVRDIPSRAVTESPLKQSTAAAVEPSLVIKDEVKDGGKAPTRSVPERTPVIPPVIPPPISPIPSQPLYIKQEPNGKASDVKSGLVLPSESSTSEPSCRPLGSIGNQTTLPSSNLDPQIQSPKASKLPPPSWEMLALKPTSSWSDVPDEDWLFAGRPLGSHPKPKAEVERGAGESSVQVWADAVLLPACELYALPYVVPY
ncbi:uncharacterized protein [Physcomitrium patens]|uniref:Uncharacterized protein n=1 Tax=Physcomitrium patens TaxID=3218 RepID=A0A2K1IFH9_PHYPA|nr:uncharacterized protein LOC112276799 [Physcomitrium patens]PNR28032.1 hypothetical protein PHYPA_028624 [Physcomitrium patens]|eukprot:XP_024364270.1 uncharacterized protein LOC112276799 [Physcomitrella patens]